MLSQIKLPKRLICGCFYISKSSYSILNTTKRLCSRNYPVLKKNTDLDNNFIKSSSMLTVVRYKYTNERKKSGSRKKFDDDSDDDDDDDDDDHDDEDDDDDELSLMKNVTEKTYKLDSLRMDLVLKTVLGFNRKKIEAAFYNVDIRVNGEVPQKKSKLVAVNDEIDVVKGTDDTNQNFLNVARVEILKISVNERSNAFMVKVRKSKSLVIENYPEGHSWKASEKII